MITPTSAVLPQPAVTSPNPPVGSPATQDLFMEYLLSAASTSESSAPAAPAPAIAAAPATSLPSPAVSSSAPYFTPDPDQYAMVTPTNGMSAYQVDSTSSYQQKFIASMVSDMSGFIDGTHSWANGGADAITQEFIAQAQQRIAAYPTGSDGDPWHWVRKMPIP